MPSAAIEPMTAEEERWAEALAIEQWKGAGAAAYIAERLAALTAANDAAGVERFQAIGARLARLHDQPVANRAL